MKNVAPLVQLLALVITCGLTVVIIAVAERTTGFLFNLSGVIEALFSLGIIGTALFSLVTVWLIHVDQLSAPHWFDHLRQSFWLYLLFPTCCYFLVRYFIADLGTIQYALLILVAASAVWGIVVNLIYLFDIQPRLAQK